MTQPPERDGPRIFIAEDDKAILDLLESRLAIAGYQTASAGDGREALTKIVASRPAAIILDVNMPVMDGFEVLRALKTVQGVARIPVMMLTARNAADDVRTAISLGAKDFLTKPFDDQHLLGRIARLLRPRPGPVYR